MSRPTNRKSPTDTHLLKWPGSKVRQASVIADLVGKVDTYAEPFLGSGAVFFELARRGAFNRAILCDYNPDLIRFWRAVQREPRNLHGKIAALPQSNPKDVYLRLREEYNETRAPELFAWLNKAAFNGLYRVNKKGRFNTPVGTVRAQLPLPTLDQIVHASKLLRRAELLHCSFTDPEAWRAETVVCDPPYVALPGKKSFVAYTSSGFPDQLQRDLIDIAERSDARVIISNSYAARDLFDPKLWKIRAISELRSIAPTGKARGRVQELIAVNESSDRPF